jgi:hypothetical protein
MRVGIVVPSTEALDAFRDDCVAAGADLQPTPGGWLAGAA